jgi:hypothetical protein
MFPYLHVIEDLKSAVILGRENQMTKQVFFEFEKTVKEVDQRDFLDSKTIFHDDFTFKKEDKFTYKPKFSPDYKHCLVLQTSEKNEQLRKMAIFDSNFEGKEV